MTDGKYHPDVWSTEGYKCTIQEVQENTSVLFDCVDKLGDPVDPITLNVGGNPPPSLGAFVPGESVRVDYFIVDDWALGCWYPQMLRIERADNVLLLAARTSCEVMADPFAPQSVTGGTTLCEWYHGPEAHWTCGWYSAHLVNVDLGDGLVGSFTPPAYGELGPYAVWATSFTLFKKSLPCSTKAGWYRDVLVLRTTP